MHVPKEILNKDFITEMGNLDFFTQLGYVRASCNIHETKRRVDFVTVIMVIARRVVS